MTTTSTPIIGGLQFVMRHVADLTAARAFYVETLGFTIEGENPGFIQFLPQNGEGAAFALGQATETTPKDAELWWYVPDADALHAELVARDMPILEAPHDEPFGRTFTIQDPDGQAVYFLQLRAAP